MKWLGWALVMIGLLLHLVACEGFIGSPRGPIRYPRVQSESEPMQPVFCLYADEDYRTLSDISTIEVFALPYRSWDEIGNKFIGRSSKARQTVWKLEYPELSWWRGLGQRLLRQPQRTECITYGDVPSGYREIIPASPLQPEQVYGVSFGPALAWLSQVGGGGLLFLIRQDENGNVSRLEYCLFDYALYTFAVYRAWDLLD